MSISSTINALRKHPIIALALALSCLIVVGASQLGSNRAFKKIEKELNRANDATREVSADITELEQELAELASFEREAIAEVNAATKIAALAQNDAERKAADKTIRKAEKKASGIARKIRRQRESLKDAKDDLNAYRIRIAELEKEIKDFNPNKLAAAEQEKATRKQAEVAEKERRRAKAKEERAMAKQQRAAAKAEKLRLKQQGRAARDAEKAVRAQAKEAAKAAAAAAGERKSQERLAKREAEKSLKQQARLEREQEKRERAARKAQEAEAKMAQEKAERSRSEQERLAAKAEKARLREEARRKRSRGDIEELRQAVIDAVVKAGKDQRHDLQQAQKDAESDLARAQSELDKTTRATDKLQSRIAQLESEQHALNAVIAAKIKDAGDAESSDGRRKANRALMQAEDDMLDVVGDVKGLRTKKQRVQQAQAEDQARLARLQTQLQQVAGSLAALDGEQQSRLNAVNARIAGADVSELRDMLDDIVKEEKERSKIVELAQAKLQRDRRDVEDAARRRDKEQKELDRKAAAAEEASRREAEREAKQAERAAKEADKRRRQAERDAEKQKQEAEKLARVHADAQRKAAEKAVREKEKLERALAKQAKRERALANKIADRKRREQERAEKLEAKQAAAIAEKVAKDEARRIAAEKELAEKVEKERVRAEKDALARAEKERKRLEKEAGRAAAAAVEEEKEDSRRAVAAATSGVAERPQTEPQPVVETTAPPPRKSGFSLWQSDRDVTVDEQPSSAAGSDRDAEKTRRDAEKEAERRQRENEKDTERARADAEKQARKEQRAAEAWAKTAAREAERADRDAERAARKKVETAAAAEHDDMSERQLAGLKRDLDDAAADYNAAQADAAASARAIDEVQFRIKEFEKAEQAAQDTLAAAIKAGDAAQTPAQKKLASKQEKEAAKKLKAVTRQLKSQRKALAKAIKNAAANQQQLDKTNAALRAAEASWAPYADSYQSREDDEMIAKAEAQKEKMREKEAKRQQKIAEELERRKKREALQLAKAKQREERRMAKAKAQQEKMEREEQEEERQSAEKAQREREKEELRLKRDETKLAKEEERRVEKEEMERQKQELKAKMEAEKDAKRRGETEVAVVEAMERDSLEADRQADAERIAGKAAAKAMEDTAGERTAGDLEVDEGERRAAEAALQKFHERRAREQEIAREMEEREKRAAELALEKANIQRMRDQKVSRVKDAGYDIPDGARYDEATFAKAKMTLRDAEDKYQQAQVELYNFENELGPTRQEIKDLQARERDAKQLYVEMTKRAAIASSDDWSRVMGEIRDAETNVNTIMEELKDSRFREAKMNIQAVQARKNLDDAKSALDSAQKKVAELESIKAVTERSRMQRMGGDTYYNRDVTERDVVEYELEQKAKAELDNAERTFHEIQEAAYKAEQDLENVQMAVRGLAAKEAEAKDVYAQKTQEALTAKGRDQWHLAIKDVRDAEEHAMEIMGILKDYQQQETQAEMDVMRTRKELEMSRGRLKIAQKAYKMYEEAARERLERERLREVELEMAAARAQRSVEKVVPGTAGPDGVSYQGVWPPDQSQADIKARAVKPDGKKFDINAVVVTGDRDAVFGLDNWPEYENDALYTPMSEADIESFRQRLLKDLQDAGYVFATVSVYKHSLNLGFLKFRVHVGKKGEVTVVGNRWYTAKQILDSASWETGEKFNYRQLYTDLFDFNTKPDVRVNTKLMPKVDEYGRRIIDVEMSIEDAFPLHGSLRLSNTGSTDDNDWRLRSTIQHLNLTRRNDILTFEWLTDPEELDQVNAFSGSYYLPLNDGRGLTLFGGYSTSEINDVAPELDIFGEGYYLGSQYSRVLKSTKKYNVDATVGWLYQFAQNRVSVSGQAVENEVTMSMPSLTIGYSEKEFDDYNGRNYWSNTIQMSFAGKFGASETDEFAKYNGGTASSGSDGDFIIDRFQFARFQKLFAGENEPGKWSLFFRLDAQLSDDNLVSPVQKGFGGANSVRGYGEREVSADAGFTGSVELQTPLVSNFLPGLQRTEEFLAANPTDWKMHRLQFVAFYDFGRSQNNEVQGGDVRSENFSSVGAGLRLGLTKYSQMRFDYGVPLDNTVETRSGRGHLSLQLQF